MVSHPPTSLTSSLTPYESLRSTRRQRLSTAISYPDTTNQQSKLLTVTSNTNNTIEDLSSDLQPAIATLIITNPRIILTMRRTTFEMTTDTPTETSAPTQPPRPQTQAQAPNPTTVGRRRCRRALLSPGFQVWIRQWQAARWQAPNRQIASWQTSW